MYLSSINHAPLLVAASLALSARAADPTYWIHESCAPYNFGDTMAESLSWATSSYTNRDNPDLQWAFKWIFGASDTTPSQEIAARYRVTNVVLADIGKMQTTNDRLSASIRIYCDNDARWTLAADRPDTPEAEKNANKPADKQYWIDQENGLRIKGAPDCSHDAESMGVTYHSRSKERDDYDKTQLRPRDVITICDSIVKVDKAENFRTLKEYIKKYRLHNKTSYRLEILASFTLLHELSHCKPWEKKDIPRPYGWDNVITNSHPQDNAENFAYLGLFAGLLDNKYRLDPTSDGARQGYLQKINSSKKRGVSARCRDLAYRRLNAECAEAVVG